MGSAASIQKTVVNEFEDVNSEEEQILEPDQDDAADMFAREMYRSSPKIDALQYVLSSEAGRDAFMTFLRTEFAEENLTFFIVSISPRY